jgi:hypothetical protein
MTVETEGGVMKRKSSRRLVRWLGLAIAVAALAPPAAQAMPISDEGAVSAAPQVLYADDLHAMVPRPVSSEPVAAAPKVLYADDLHAMLPRPVSTEPRLDGLIDSLGRPLEPPPTEVLVDSLGRPLGPPDVVQPVSHVAPASTGFDWSDAGIGAVSVFGLMLLGIGVLLVGRHNRRSRLAAI